MTPVVYLFEQQISEIFKESGGKTIMVSGDAYGWDFDTVFHAYAKSPMVRPAWLQTTCLFFLSVSPTLFHEVQNHIERISSEQGASKQMLFIFFVKDKNHLLHKAFLRNESASIECEVHF